VPLLPVYSLLVAILLEDLFVEGKESLRKIIAVRRPWSMPAQCGLLILVALLNLWPQGWLPQVRPFGVFREYACFMLQEESARAIRCLDPGSRVTSNYPNLLYFYSKGEHQVFKMRLPGSKETALSERETLPLKRRKATGPSPSEERLMRPSEVNEALQRAGIDQAVIFLSEGKTVHLHELIEGLRREGALKVTVRCEDEGLVVYDLVRGAEKGPTGPLEGA